MGKRCCWLWKLVISIKICLLKSLANTSRVPEIASSLGCKLALVLVIKVMTL